MIKRNMCNCVEEKSDAFKRKYNVKKVCIDMDVFSGRIAFGFSYIDENDKKSVRKCW